VAITKIYKISRKSLVRSVPYVQWRLLLGSVDMPWWWVETGSISDWQFIPVKTWDIAKGTSELVEVKI